MATLSLGESFFAYLAEASPPEPPPMTK